MSEQFPHTISLTKMTPRCLGLPENLPQFVKDNPGKNALPLGVIMGMAQKLEIVYGPPDKATGVREEYEAIKGRFLAWPYDSKAEWDSMPRRRATYSSGVLYLPTGLDELVKCHVRDLQAAIDAGEHLPKNYVEVALMLGVQTATNPRGYSWYAKMFVQPLARERDPLIELQERASHLALEAPAVHAVPSPMDPVDLDPDLPDVAPKGKAKARR